MPKSQAQREADRRYEKGKGKDRKRKYRAKLIKPPKPKKVCSECGGIHYAKGLCNKHYNAARRANKK